MRIGYILPSLCRVFPAREVPYRFVMRWIGTWAPDEKKARLFRILHANTKPHGKGWFSEELSVNIVARFIGFERGVSEWRISLLGLQLHWHRSYGGWFV